MKKIMSYIASLLIFLMCSCSHKITSEIVTYNDSIYVDATTIFATELYVNHNQFDSICVVENINSDLNEWLFATYVDYETNIAMKEYMYVIGDSINITTIYKLRYNHVENNDTIYKYTKINFNK